MEKKSVLCKDLLLEDLKRANGGGGRPGNGSNKGGGEVVTCICDRCKKTSNPAKMHEWCGLSICDNCWKLVGGK